MRGAILAGRARSAGARAWGWVGRNWLALLLPPAVFLLGAGVTHQVGRAWEGVGFGRWLERYRAAMAAEAAGDRVKALALLEQSEAVAPDEPRAQLELARGFRRLGQAARALDHSERSLRLKPKAERENLAAWLGLVGFNYAEGRFDVAGRILERDVLPRWPDSPAAHCYAGRLRMLRDPSEAGLRGALASFEASLRLDPKLADARLDYGTCLARLGRLDEAERALRAVVEADPYSRKAQHELAGVLRRAGKADEAGRALARFEELGRKQRRLRHLETQLALEKNTLADLLEIGRLYLDDNQPDAALRALLRYTKQEPTDPAGHRALGDAYRRLKRPEDAELADRLAVALEGRGGRR